MPKAVVLNASENGYYYGGFSDESISYIISNMHKLDDDIIRFKVFQHLFFERSYLDFLDYAPIVV